MTPPNPGKGYRLLDIGDEIAASDDVQSFNIQTRKWRGWVTTIRAGTTVTVSDFKDGLAYRRKLKPKAKKCLLLKEAGSQRIFPA